MKLKTSEESTHVFPPGKYWIGDPCYVYGDDWLGFCDCFDGIGRDGGYLQYVKTPFFVCGTADGDGEYDVKQHGSKVGTCGVDAGLLSVIPMALVKKWLAVKKYDGTFKKETYGGTIIQADSCFEIEASGGDFNFGPFSVNTSGEGEEEHECTC